MKRTFAATTIAAVVTLAACGGGNDPAAPGAPTAVAASLDSAGTSVVVAFSPPAEPGGAAITGYAVASVPAGLTATGAASPITVACGGSCAGKTFAVSAVNAGGAGAASAAAHVVTAFDVVATFSEPMTQPNDTIFTGSFTLDSSTRTVSGLQGSLTESMTMPDGVSYGAPMTTVSLSHQLSAVSDGLGGNGLLVTTFLLDTVDTFFVAAGTTYPLGTFDPANTGGVYHGFPDAWSAATANAYAMIRVDPDAPTAAPTQAQLDKLAYADCTAGGMMMAVCMTGTADAGYGHMGSMMGTPASQVITRR